MLFEVIQTADSFRVIHWETIVTKVTLMAMKFGCQIYTQNVT